jgi:hypothetical protein
MSSIELLPMNRRFDGFRNTQFLWRESLDGLKMYTNSDTSTRDYPKVDAVSPIRLGKLIEQFVLWELEKGESTEVLKSNVQVFSKQITIGELDCLVKQLGDYIHLEIIYKFYLYDPSIPEELQRWIGPNRNDSLVQKLNKLKEKQLPLLFHEEAAHLLHEMNLKATDFKQKVYFKAQLFVPFDLKESTFRNVNSQCVKGFYICQGELSLFVNYTYYIPEKLDWLVDPHLDVRWLTALTFQNEISVHLAAKKSPLCWMKSADGVISKFFIVWW